MKIFDRTLGTLERALDARLLRHNVLAGNLANADTPGFVPRDVDFAAAMRESAFSTFSRELNALMRTWPSPHLPKPAPGVQTTWAWLSSRSKNSHESRPVFTQM